jgi:predicted RNA-binding protein with PIN domain
MIPHYIIDGYNLIHAVPSLKQLLQHDGYQARERLIAAVSRLTFKKKFRCTIVFDGAKPIDIQAPSSHAPIHIVFSSPVSADAKIRDMITASKNRTQLVIISSDHEILNYAKVCSCATHTSKYFAVLLFEESDSGEEKEDVPLTKNQVDDWIRLFEKGKKE